ncbi:hypothetical protein NDA01_05410 [Trichocoleus desertorum AS-A10]|uniref:hypothetical protein n=1 Tax=Trichocoleus desertorum TaxID=1481672 RepID=UPI003298DE2C
MHRINLERSQAATMLTELIQALEQDPQEWIEQDVCLLMNKVSWLYYAHLLSKFQENASLRLNYLDGVLEIVAPVAAMKELKNGLRRCRSLILKKLILSTFRLARRHSAVRLKKQEVNQMKVIVWIQRRQFLI